MYNLNPGLTHWLLLSWKSVRFPWNNEKKKQFQMVEVAETASLHIFQKINFLKMANLFWDL